MFNAEGLLAEIEQTEQELISKVMLSDREHLLSLSVFVRLMSISNLAQSLVILHLYLSSLTFLFHHKLSLSLRTTLGNGSAKGVT